MQRGLGRALLRPLRRRAAFDATVLLWLRHVFHRLQAPPTSDNELVPVDAATLRLSGNEFTAVTTRGLGSRDGSAIAALTDACVTARRSRYQSMKVSQSMEPADALSRVFPHSVDDAEAVWHVAVTVANTGTQPGQEIVQVTTTPTCLPSCLARVYRTYLETKVGRPWQGPNRVPWLRSTMCFCTRSRAVRGSEIEYGGSTW